MQSRVVKKGRIVGSEFQVLLKFKISDRFARRYFAESEASKNDTDITYQSVLLEDLFEENCKELVSRLKEEDRFNRWYDAAAILDAALRHLHRKFPYEFYGNETYFEPNDSTEEMFQEEVTRWLLDLKPEAAEEFNKAVQEALNYEGSSCRNHIDKVAEIQKWQEEDNDWEGWPAWRYMDGDDDEEAADAP